MFKDAYRVHLTIYPILTLVLILSIHIVKVNIGFGVNRLVGFCSAYFNVSHYPYIL